MGERFERSWELCRECYALLAADRTLMLFPLMSALAMIVIMASFALPLLPLLGFFQGRHGFNAVPGLSYLALFIFYWIQFSVVIFFNTALVEVAMQRFDGKDATVSDGLARAWSLLPTILAYGAIAATVGTVLRLVADRVGFLGRIVIGLLGFAWTVATALVVPVLAAENIGAVDAVKRSVELIKKAWGEDIIGNAGIGLVFAIVMVAAILTGGVFTLLAFSSGSVALGVLVGLLTVIALALIVLTQTTLQGIYSAALYRYANNDPATGPLDKSLLSNAFSAKT
jgi:hypothetical protein